MNIRVLLAGSDVNYISRLSDIMSRTSARKSYVLEVTIFTNRDKMKATLEGKKGATRTKYHIALVDESMVDILHENGEFSTLVVLTDDSNKDGVVGDNSELCVYKFQQVSEIVRKFMSAFTGESNNSNCHICVFYSDIGGSGTSTVAVSFAMAAVKEGKRPLYVSLERISSTEAFFKDTNVTQGLSAIFACKKDDEMKSAISTMKAQDASGVYFFKPFSLESSKTKPLIEPTGLTLFIDSIQATEDIDMLILDIGTGTHGQYCLDRADAIFIVAGNGQIAQMKLAQTFDKYENLNKTYLISNQTQDSTNSHNCKSITNIPAVMGGSPSAVSASITGYISGLVQAVLEG